MLSNSLTNLNLAKNNRHTNNQPNQRRHRSESNHVEGRVDDRGGTKTQVRWWSYLHRQTQRSVVIVLLLAELFELQLT